jgi:TatD DNase family protein
MLLPNIDGRSLRAMHSLCTAYPENCFPMIGLHPGSVKEDYREELDHLWKSMEEYTYRGIGESGIDLYRDKTYAGQQEDSFREHIRLARQSGLPLVIHARNSFSELFRILDAENNDGLTGIFHAFTGSADQARRIIDYGFKLGIGGIVTFKNAGLDKVVREIDLSHVVLETDAPYLAPVPFRGKRNEPAYLVNTAEKIAELHTLSLEEVARVTTRNAATLFNLNI